MDERKRKVSFPVSSGWPEETCARCCWGRWAKVGEKPTTTLPSSLFSPVGWRNRERVTRCLVARSVVLCSLRLGEGENVKGSRVGRVQGRGSLVEERGRKQRTQYAPKRRRSCGWATRVDVCARVCVCVYTTVCAARIYVIVGKVQRKPKVGLGYS